MGLGEVTIEISEVYEFEGEVMQNGQKKNGHSIGIKGRDKRIILNAGNRRALSFAFGAMSGEWVGKKATVRAVDGRKNPSGGAPVWGLEIKAKADPELLKAKRESMTGGEG